MTPAEHLDLHDEGVGAPMKRPIDQFVDPAVFSQLERDRERRHDAWQKGLRDKSCQKAAEDVGALGNALLIWIDGNGEMRARRISREDSIIREFVPAYLRRSQQ